MDIGQGRVSNFPSDGGLTPSRSMIFMMRLQNGIHARATDRAAVFPMIWKMWTNVNRESCNKITQELSSSKIDEGSVGQQIEVREHDQL